MRQEIAARWLTNTGLRAVLGSVCRWSGIACLNYHRIGDGTRSVFDRGLWSATEEAFDAQVRFLKSNFDVVSPHDLPDIVRRRRGRHVLITFDDGYRDNYSTAFPILKRHRVPATFFITTGFLDHPRLAWWDEIAWMVRTSAKDPIELPGRLSSPLVFDEPDREWAVRTLVSVYKKIPSEKTAAYLDDIREATASGRDGPADAASNWMTWDMVREMRAAGMSFGGHTVSHPILANMSREEQQREVQECGRRLFEELGEPMRYFSYPVGGRKAFNQETGDCLREAGVEYAFSYYGGYCRFDEWDKYDIRRAGIESHTTLDWFRAIITLPQWF